MLPTIDPNSDDGDGRLPPADVLYIGIDGGGSNCRARLRDSMGRLRGTADGGGAANVYLDFDGAIRTIRRTIETLAASRGFDSAAVCKAWIGLGLAGVSSETVADRVRASLADFGHVAVVHDGVAACLGAHAGGDGGLVIAGTGSAAVLRLHGVNTSFGGRGFILGDDGSGAWIGRSIWQHALRAFDGLAPRSTFLDGLMGEFGQDPSAVIAWARTAPSHAFAAYAPQVFAAADAGDPAAAQVIRTAAGSIAELIESLNSRGAPRISLVGGMAGAISPQLPQRARDLLEPAIADALEGALLLVGAPRAVQASGTALL